MVQRQAGVPLRDTPSRLENQTQGGNMNWKFWQRKPKADVFGPVEKWVPSLTADQFAGKVYEKAAEFAGKAPEPVDPLTDVAPAPVDPDRMNPEIRARWVERLRSGNYRQGVGRLKYRRAHQKTEYCCLGVLCEIAVEDGVIEPPEISRGETRAVYRFNGNGSTLPEKVVAWAGLKSYNPSVTGETGKMATLAELNDVDKLCFSDIADVIEKQL